MSITHTRTRTFTGTSLVKPLVKSILEHPEGHEWSLQGFGMLRTYLGSRDLRLHIWDSRFKVEEVSELHTHPWNFHSFVVAGEVENKLFMKVDPERASVRHEPFVEQEILCGEGGHETPNSTMVALRVDKPSRIHKEGDEYSQFAHEIHRSLPADGSVTIIQREFLGDDDHAFVYIPEGDEWISAEPRPATDEEVAAICTDALARWF